MQDLSVISRLAAAIILFLTIPIAAQGLSDPLNSAYKPSIDANCTHSQYAANIWLTDTMQKLRQDNTDIKIPSNSCYLTVYATQNEFVG